MTRLLTPAAAPAAPAIPRITLELETGKVWEFCEERTTRERVDLATAVAILAAFPPLRHGLDFLDHERNAYTVREDRLDRGLCDAVIVRVIGKDGQSKMIDEPLALWLEEAAARAR